MNILFYIGHPAQYHFIKNTMANLLKDGHSVRVLIKTKDVLENLLKEDGVDYTNIQTKSRKNNSWSIFIAMLKRTRAVIREAKSFKPDILIGEDVSIAWTGRLLGIPAITIIEDDYDVVKREAVLSYPATKHILCPDICSVGPWENKKIGYKGYMKFAYLHPNVFDPDLGDAKTSKPYAIIRISGLQAFHDVKIKGLSEKVILDIIYILESYGLQVLLSSERTIPASLKQYQFAINATEMHNYLANAALLISDSQSMSVEAALLGVPSIRCSDFAGRISVLEELEQQYQLTFGFKPSKTNEITAKIQELLSLPNRKELFQARRQKMLSDKIDVTAFLTWFIENYPQSADIMKKNPDYQFRFK